MKVNLTLTVAEAKAVKIGLESALEFWDTYYMFAPKNGDLNQGSYSLDEKRRALAYGVIENINNQLDE